MGAECVTHVLRSLAKAVPENKVTSWLSFGMALSSTMGGGMWPPLASLAALTSVGTQYKTNLSVKISLCHFHTPCEIRYFRIPLSQDLN